MDIQPDQEFHYEIFGSILDQTEMTLFLLQSAVDYATSLIQATRMMANHGFDTTGSVELRESKSKRAMQYIRHDYDYYLRKLLPFVSDQLNTLISCAGTRRSCFHKGY